MIKSLRSEESSGRSKSIHHDSKSVSVEVVFGTPSKHCTGAGICMVSLTPFRNETLKCPQVHARLCRVPDEGLVFLFPKTNISSFLRSKYFSSPQFLVEERFPIPFELARAWQLRTRWIPPGLYHLEEYSREWRLFLGMPQAISPR